eukprot:3546842-Pleurochrysis_carterae.AAC.1
MWRKKHGLGEKNMEGVQRRTSEVLGLRRLQKRKGYSEGVREEDDGEGSGCLVEAEGRGE